MTNTPALSALKAIAPLEEDLIEDLLAYHVALDPEDEDGFSSRELWDWRLAQFGYLQLFSDWLLIPAQD